MCKTKTYPLALTSSNTRSKPKNFAATLPEEVPVADAGNGAIYQSGHDVPLFENSVAHRVGDEMRRDPHLVWDFYSMRRHVASAAKPNPAHLALAKLENRLRDRLFLCTQNVDSLHEQAGSKNVIHMHGELFKSRCDTCDRPPFEDLNTYEASADIPGCDCGGRIRPHICWFGEIPFQLDRVFRALEECTVFMAVGTSGVIEPAASFVRHVADHARTIYVGPEDPANALLFAERHKGNAGEILPGLVAVL